MDWSRPAVELERRVRAMHPWPGAFTTWNGTRLKVLRAAVAAGWKGREPPGTVVRLEDGVAVATGEGALRLLEVQLAGRRAMGIEPFLRGQRGFVGSVLGT